jgi:hypothetical protein
MSHSDRIFRMKKANLFEGRKKNERGKKKKSQRIKKDLQNVFSSCSSSQKWHQMSRYS